jgi:hypothetical protein
MDAEVAAAAAVEAVAVAAVAVVVKVGINNNADESGVATDNTVLLSVVVRMRYQRPEGEEECTSAWR